jgi:Membrane bound FAD containing D-sorbitol dehydrogenase
MKEKSSPTMLDQFMALSEILTGCELDAEQGRAHFDRLLSTPLVPSIPEVLKHFARLPKRTAAEVERKLVADAELRPTICQIVLLWYTSALRDSSSDPSVLRYGSEQAYFGGLVWRILGAHPPGLSGGYFGHWRYRPDNEPKGTPR